MSNNQSKHTPFRCFEGSAKPYEPFWKFSNNDETGEAELELYGVISEYSWMGDEISPKKFREELHTVGKGGPITLKINSPGGDVIAASVMRSIMTEYPGAITARIDGMAASAAVLVAMSAKTVKIMDSAYMMIHDPAITVMFASMNIEMLGDLRDDLKKIKKGLVESYAGRTGLSEEKLSTMMADETWMSASEAVTYGFADEVISGGQKAANKIGNKAYVNALQNYVNVPQALLQRAENVEAEELPEASTQADAKLDPRRVESLRNYLRVYVPSNQ